ncbi:hypothetical protein llap_20364 [Limosa lapponica baueri]|uniref:Uncharacterized protein n=1 Tax=Limosa lapponica baueri TaxID=1758121 RepID=A0A2I0T6C0_LIMLA|nr:hypothetical protein llap_20364 [Limosa lapponica baueri]
MLTTLNRQEFWEKVRVPRTSEEMRGSLQDQALAGHGKVEDVESSFRKILIKKAEIFYLYYGVEDVMNS